MTALQEYTRLESTGLWRPSPDGQRRDVVVAFGDATLSLTDKNDSALAHWSLPAITRLNPGKRPAIFSPDEGVTETLELDDEAMIRAIEKVLTTIARRTPHPGRLRLLAMGGSLAAVIALAVFWVPNALVQHTASVVPDVTRNDIGARLLDHIKRLSGESCHSTLGDRALNRLRMRVAPDMRKLAVLPDGVKASEHLPGRYVLLNKSLVEDYEEPAIAAGFIVAETLRFEAHDPLERLLGAAGIITTFRLLTSGEVSESALSSYAEQLLVTDSAQLSDEALLNGFQRAGLHSTPYAYALDVSGETSLGLIEADPFANAPTPAVLSDGDWISLQAICSD